MDKVNIQLEYWQILGLKRKELKIKQEELADKLNISPMYLSHFENGRREAKISLIKKWANELNYEIKLSINKKNKTTKK